MKLARTLPVIEDCYRRIGVFGDRSCPKLATVVHCHSCDVLAGVAHRLLERPAIDDYVTELTEQLAKPLDVSHTADRSFVLFELSGERLALPTSAVAEVSVISKAPCRMPHRSNAAFAGLINLHGQLELCFWLESLVGRDRVAGQLHGSALVLANDGQRWVLLIDRVEGVHRTHAEAVLPAPPRSARREGALICGLLQRPEGLYGLLDVSKLCASLVEAMQ